MMEEQDRLKEQIMDLSVRRFLAYRKLLEISSKQYAAACRDDMDEFDVHSSLQDDLRSVIEQLNVEIDVPLSNDLFQEDETLKEVFLQTVACMHSIEETFQRIQKVLSEKNSELGKEVLMLKERCKVLKSYRQGGSSTS